MTTSDRKRGAFLGLATGDCFGAPVEGMPAWEIQKRFERVTEILDPFEVWARRPERGRLRGLHTDDTQQAWMLADVLLEQAASLSDALAARFLSFNRPRPDLPRGLHRGTGKGFRSAMDALSKGTPALEAGLPTGSNGAAMRIAPVGIHYSDRPDDLVRHALLASAVTHRDPRSMEAAASLAFLVGALVGSAPPSDTKGRFEAAIEGARRAEELVKAGWPVTVDEKVLAFSGGFRSVLEAVANGEHAPDQILGTVAKVAGTLGAERMIKRGTEAFAPASVASSMAIAITAESFRAALEILVNAGEDTDSTCAMGGAVAGARFGASAIPSSWLDVLVAKEPLLQVAAVLAGETGTLPQQEPLEEGWTRAERDEALRRAREDDDDFEE
jgi:ADP-ribosyl-[dinitrogen reductase] hydrolase